MEKLLILIAITLSLTACKNKQAPETDPPAAEQTLENKHKERINECVKLLSEFQTVSAKVTDEASFDENLEELNSINEKLLKHAAESRTLDPPSEEIGKRLLVYLKSQLAEFEKLPASVRKFEKIKTRKDEVAVLMEDFDSALFGNYMTFSLLYMAHEKPSKYGGKLTTPAEAHIDVSDKTILQFDDDLKATLFRYLAGNPRWEIREERGKIYAVRLEAISQYQTSLNGFYSYDGKQTRVLISFERKYGFGRQRDNITEAEAGTKDLPVIIEAPHSGTPGHSSYTIISGGKIFLEIYDQAPELERIFTQTTFKEISAELKAVIKYRKNIDAKGVMPESAKSHYPVALPTKPSFEIDDGSQPGIFSVKASIHPTQSGSCYLKVFNVKTGERLSEDRITPRSTRHVGWSMDEAIFFPYTSQVTVYEGNWTTKYEARFELWHKGKDGAEQKLAEKQRMINGWQR